MQPSRHAIAERAAGGVGGVVARLREAIAPLHLEIEATAVARAMVEASITLESYVDLLCRLEPVHEVLERRLTTSSLRDFVPGPLVFRAGALRRDLAALRKGCVVADAARSSLSVWFETASDGHLVGGAYVIAGSALGSAVLRPSLAKAFQTLDQSGDGLDYHRIPADVVREEWPAFLARLERLPDELAAHATDGARRAMTGMVEIYSQPY